MPTPAAPAGHLARIASIDLLRGVAMALMAIDHVRVFSGIPAGGSTPGVFFTRWITHFCAPAFVFLAGASVSLSGRTKGDLTRHLLTRGLWLVFLELTWVRVAWTFNLDFAHYQLAGVLWVIGWCLVLMAGLVRLPIRVVGALGLAIIAGHNLLDPLLAGVIEGLPQDPLSWLWKVGYLAFLGGPVSLGPDGPSLTVLYSLVPWIGVMAAGYGFAPVLTLEAWRRDRICLALGLGAIALFLVLRGFDLYGEPRPWATAAPTADGRPQAPAALRFLNTTKYPASLQFLLMTLGPMLALVPWAERARGLLSRSVAFLGRVPLFFYLLHLPLIHLLAVLVSLVRTGSVSPWLFTNHPLGNPRAPAGDVWSLGLLYLVWAVAMVVLFLACRWFAGLKARRRSWWLDLL